MSRIRLIFLLCNHGCAMVMGSQFALPEPPLWDLGSPPRPPGVGYDLRCVPTPTLTPGLLPLTTQPPREPVGHPTTRYTTGDRPTSTITTGERDDSLTPSAAPGSKYTTPHSIPTTWTNIMMVPTSEWNENKWNNWNPKTGFGPTDPDLFNSTGNRAGTSQMTGSPKHKIWSAAHIVGLIIGLCIVLCIVVVIVFFVKKRSLKYKVEPGSEDYGGASTGFMQYLYNFRIHGLRWRRQEDKPARKVSYQSESSRLGLMTADQNGGHGTQINSSVSSNNSENWDRRQNQNHSNHHPMSKLDSLHKQYKESGGMELFVHGNTAKPADNAEGDNQENDKKVRKKKRRTRGMSRDDINGMVGDLNAENEKSNALSEVNCETPDIIASTSVSRPLHMSESKTSGNISHEMVGTIPIEKYKIKRSPHTLDRNPESHHYAGQKPFMIATPSSMYSEDSMSDHGRLINPKLHNPVAVTDPEHHHNLPGETYHNRNHRDAIPYQGPPEETFGNGRSHRQRPEISPVPDDYANVYPGVSEYDVQQPIPPTMAQRLMAYVPEAQSLRSMVSLPWFHSPAADMQEAAQRPDKLPLSGYDHYPQPRSRRRSDHYDNRYQGDQGQHPAPPSEPLLHKYPGEHQRTTPTAVPPPLSVPYRTAKQGSTLPRGGVLQPLSREQSDDGSYGYDDRQPRHHNSSNRRHKRPQRRRSSSRRHSSCSEPAEREISA